MKTSGLILIVIVLISGSISAQNMLKLKTDSLFPGNDTVFPKQSNQLNLLNPLAKEQPRLFLPNSNQFLKNSNPAVVPDNNLQSHSNSHFRMPVMSPSYQSNMPVMKPDSSIHYHLLIKRIRK